ncbi:MAG TPA: DUF1501 domain-containing protein [Bryobacteraceae bacterium]|nr:DUF1501 domain-containing protein [Bryobacteraceae bacterium]
MTDREFFSRRELLARTGLGFGTMALSWMLEQQGLLGATAGEPVSFDTRPKSPHFAPKAKAVIQLMQNGGPSQMDLFDPKPELNKRSGQKHQEKLETLQGGSADNKLMGSPFKFGRYGQCGMELSELLPHTASIADEICLVRSMHSEHNNHSEALIMFQTGKIFPGRPTTGAWVSYALGTENQNLPAFVVLRDPDGYNTNGALVWDNGWLPALYRGTEFSSKGSPVLDLKPAVPGPKGSQEDRLNFLAKLNERHRERYPEDTSLDARIKNYELAARMQMAASGALDLSMESEATKKLYGLDNPETASYSTRCLMARRLVEAGVRFVQVFPGVKPSIQPWDHHSNLEEGLKQVCGMIDLGSAALIKDLKSRGLLDDVIVMWSGEFGRLPISQKGTGRDHNRHAFSLWMAGGGFRKGYIHGTTDEIGYRAAENAVSVPELHATVLNQLGLDHKRLTFRHHGREESLTDYPVTHAEPARKLLA